MNFNDPNPNPNKFSYLRLLLDEEKDENQLLHMSSSNTNNNNNVPQINISSSSNGTGIITNPSLKFSQNGPNPPMNHQTIIHLGQVGLIQRVRSRDHHHHHHVVRRAVVLPNRVEVTQYLPPQINCHHQLSRFEVTEVIRTTTHFLPPNPTTSNIIRNPSLPLTNIINTTFRSRGLSIPANTYPASFSNANVPIRGSHQESDPSSSTPTPPKPNGGFNEPEPTKDGGHNINHDQGVQPLEVVPLRMVSGDNNTTTTTTTLTNQLNPPCINGHDRKKLSQNDNNNNNNNNGKHPIVLPKDQDPWLHKDCDDLDQEASTSYPIKSSSARHTAGKGKLDNTGRTRSVRGMGSKGGAYMCPRCDEEFPTSQSYASHAMSHYRFEPIEKSKKRHAIRHQSKNLRIVSTPQGITIAPHQMLADEQGILINGPSSGPKRRKTMPDEEHEVGLDLNAPLREEPLESPDDHQEGDQGDLVN